MSAVADDVTPFRANVPFPLLEKVLYAGGEVSGSTLSLNRTNANTASPRTAIMPKDKPVTAPGLLEKSRLVDSQVFASKFEANPSGHLNPVAVQILSVGHLSQFDDVTIER